MQLWENFIVGNATHKVADLSIMRVLSVAVLDDRDAGNLLHHMCCEDLRCEAYARVLLFRWTTFWSDGGTAGGGASWEDGQSICFFVNIYARIGDRATSAVDYESSWCFFGLLLLIR